MVTVAWQRGAQGGQRAFSSRDEAEAWIKVVASGLAASAERCHVRLLEGEAVVWSPVYAPISHYVHEARSFGWTLYRGERLEVVERPREVVEAPLPMAAE